MKNKIQDGKVLEYPNATGLTIAGGSLVVFGTLAGIAVNDIPEGESGSIALYGVFELPKASGAIALGDRLYWDAAAKNMTKTASVNIPVGACAAPAPTTAATVQVLLLPSC